MEPVIRGHVVLGDGDEARQPRLGAEQIVVRGVERVGPFVIADGEQLALRIVQEAEIHRHAEGERAIGDRREAAGEGGGQPGGRRRGETPLAHREQMAGEIAAVDRRDVRRLEDVQVVEVVPVVEMPAIASQASHGVDGLLQPRGRIARADEAQFVRAEDGEQVQPDVRRRRAHRHRGHGVVLEVVRRKPVRLRAGEAIEERPVQSRIANRLVTRLGREMPFGQAGGTAQPTRDEGRRQPEGSEREQCTREMRQRHIGHPNRGAPGDSGEQRCHQHESGPHRANHSAHGSRHRLLGARRRLPLEQMAPRDAEPPERARDGARRHPRLMRKEGECERHLLRADDRIVSDRRVVGAPRSVEGRTDEREGERDDPRCGNEPDADARPPQRRSGEQRPSGDHECELRDLERTAAQVVEDLPAREQGQPVALRSVGAGHPWREPAQELPVSAYPAPLAAGIAQVLRGIVVVDHDVGGEAGARVAAFDQVVGQQDVLGEPAVRRLFERVNVVDPLARETSFAVEVLVDVGDRGGVRIHARMAGVDRREP